MLGIVEIDADNRFAARILFDLDDINAAFEELDARYGAGEAAAHAHTWSVMAALYPGFNRHELPATTPDWVYIDHRPLMAMAAICPHPSVPSGMSPRTSASTWKLCTG